MPLAATCDRIGSAGAQQARILAPQELPYKSCVSGQDARDGSGNAPSHRSVALARRPTNSGATTAGSA